MSDAVTVKVRKVLSNPLLGRKQLVSVWATHSPPPVAWLPLLRARARLRAGGAHQGCCACCQAKWQQTSTQQLPQWPALPAAPFPLTRAASPPLPSPPPPPTSLLQVVEVSHPNRSSQPKEEVTKLVAQIMKADVKNTVVFGFSTAFGGGRSTGFGLVYDSADMLKKIEPKHRLIRLGLATKKTRTRKQWKDSKRKAKRTWGEWGGREGRAAGRSGARARCMGPGTSHTLHTHAHYPFYHHLQQALAGGRQHALPRRQLPAKQTTAGSSFSPPPCAWCALETLSALFITLLRKCL